MRLCYNKRKEEGKMSYIERLRELCDPMYRDFCSTLIPNITKERILGVRLPTLRRFAASLDEQERRKILGADTLYYIEECHLRSFLISRIKDYDECLGELDRFLPSVDNWAVCDSLRPSCFKRNKHRLLSYIDRLLSSEHTYTKRFAIEMLMLHFLDDAFDNSILERVSVIRSEEYYLNMMIAWFFSAALTKRWEETIVYIEEKRLPIFVHNKTISKVTDSLSVPEKRKEYIKKFKVKML